MPQLLGPCSRACELHEEKPLQQEAQASQREKTCAAVKTQRSKNKYIINSILKINSKHVLFHMVSAAGSFLTRYILPA